MDVRINVFQFLLKNSTVCAEIQRGRYACPSMPILSMYVFNVSILFFCLGPLPVVALEPSLFSTNMAKLIGDSSSGTDVTFIFPDKSTMEAHRLVLCCMSTLFRRIFLSNTAITNLNSANPEDKIGGKLTSKDINNGRVSGLVLVSTDRDVPYDCVYFEESQTIFLTLSDDISKSALSDVLNFMYTGKLDLSAKSEDKHAMAVLDLARTFQIDILTEYFKDDQEMSEQDLLEQWKAEFVSFNNELFCNTSRFSDVSFRVEGQLVRAHLCVLVAHCDFMAAMLSGNFQESGQKEVCVYVQLDRWSFNNII